jgi:hypothetical protein
MKRMLKIAVPRKRVFGGGCEAGGPTEVPSESESGPWLPRGPVESADRGMAAVPVGAGLVRSRRGEDRVLAESAPHELEARRGR